MTPQIDEMICVLDKLTPSEKGMIAQYLIASLDKRKEDETVVEQWAELSKKRYDEIVSGRVKTVSWENIKNKVLG